MVLVRWSVVMVFATIAAILDLRQGKIHNRLNGLFLMANLVMLIIDFNGEYVIAFIISVMINLLLVGRLYMGGDAKLMINISLAIGYKSFYVFLFMLILMLIIYSLKSLKNYIKAGTFKFKNTTICGPAICGAVIMTYILFYGTK